MKESMKEYDEGESKENDGKYEWNKKVRIKKETDGLI